jgi:hypothetical protein
MPDAFGTDEKKTPPKRGRVVLGYLMIAIACPISLVMITGS